MISSTQCWLSRSIRQVHRGSGGKKTLQSWRSGEFCKGQVELGGRGRRSVVVPLQVAHSKVLHRSSKAQFKQASSPDHVSRNQVAELLSFEREAPEQSVLCSVRSPRMAWAFRTFSGQRKLQFICSRRISQVSEIHHSVFVIVNILR